LYEVNGKLARAHKIVECFCYVRNAFCMQVVTTQEILDGARMTLPLPEAVVKSVERHQRKDNNRRIDDEDI